MEHEWRAASTQPEGAVCMTKIDDAQGVRNECALRKQGNLWFVPDGSMYVYYRPTHYRPLTEDEDAAWRQEIRRTAVALAAKADQ